MKTFSSYAHEPHTHEVRTHELQVLCFKNGARQSRQVGARERCTMQTALMWRVLLGRRERRELRREEGEKEKRKRQERGERGGADVTLWEEGGWSPPLKRALVHA